MKEYQHRWLIRRDTPTVLAIEQLGSTDPWTEADLLKHLKCRNKIGCVCTNDDLNEIYGYMVYELHKSRVHIERLCVDPAMRRRGVAAAMISRLKDKFINQRRRYLTANVHESQLAVQLTLASQGFVATGMEGELIEFEYQTAASLQSVREDGHGEWTT